MHDIKTLHKQGTYCKHIYITLHIPSVYKKFILKDNTLYKLIQHSEKWFKTLIVHKSLVFTIQVNSFHSQGHAGKNKTYSLIKRDFFWKYDKRYLFEMTISESSTTSKTTIQLHSNEITQETN